MILYFLRHALAEDRETWTGDDSLRPLTKKGEKDLARVADSMSRYKLGIDLILTSPYLRAYHTALIVAKVLDKTHVLIQDDRLAPGFGLTNLKEILKDHQNEDNLLLVGHEPDFSQTVSDLIGGGRLIFKKSGLARVDLTSDSPPQGELAWLLSPKIM